MSGCILYAINNCGNESVLFGVNLVCGDGFSCIGGFTFIATLFIYRLFSSWIFQYTLLSIKYDSQPLLFHIPPIGFAYINPILPLIYISFAPSSAASSTTPTTASSAFKSSASSSSYSYPIWVDLPSTYIPS